MHARSSLIALLVVLLVLASAWSVDIGPADIDIEADVVVSIAPPTWVVCWLNDWDIGWIAKSTYFLCPQCGSHTPTGPPRRVYLPRGPPRRRVSSEDDDSCGRVSTALASARSSCDQQSMASLTGFSIPFQLLGPHWYRSRHGLNRCQRTSPLTVLVDDPCINWFRRNGASVGWNLPLCWEPLEPNLRVGAR